MKKYLIIFLLICIFLSCEKENDTNPGSSYFWSPVVNVEKGDKEATLSLIDPRPFTDYYPCPPSNPEYFEIYYSNDINALTFYKKVDFSTSSVTIPNLTNGESYYFMATSNKGDFDPIFTDTVMTIPSIIEEPEEIFPNLDFSIRRVLLSHDKTYMTFISNDFSNQYYGTNMLYYTDTSIDSIEPVEIDSYDARWSNSTNMFAYLSTTTLYNTIYPYKLKLFDVKLKKATTLFEIDFNKYYILTPLFSPDDKLLSFLSSENSSEKYNYNIWTIDLSTKIKYKISYFESLYFLTEGHLDWPSDGKNIYLDGHYQSDSYKNNIYKLNISTGKLLPVIVSPWDDRTPSISPDNSKIAFISDRTGTDELWICNLTTMKYGQVTGGSSYHFDSRYTNIQWLNNNELVLTVFKDSSSRVVKIGTE
jgi:hypothetical protein